jgi:hypothetical protein
MVEVDETWQGSATMREQLLWVFAGAFLGMLIWSIPRFGSTSGVIALLLLFSDGASATVRISDDVGGRIGTYVDFYTAARNSGERVVIDGVCLSACTLVLGLVPRERICVTRRATLGFHAAWMPGPNGQPIPSAVGTQVLWEVYPTSVRRWISARGGLTKKMKFLRGRELYNMYPQCRDEAWSN